MSTINSVHFRTQDRDEYYTPPILVKPILQYLKPKSIVWCPFDTFESEFVQQITKAGHFVIHSHIWNGQDFFTMEVPKCDYIISNPPFTKKLEVFQRLYEIGKPFAMIMGLPVLNYQNVCEFFVNKDVQFLIMDKKVSFDGRTSSFNNSYICHNILPKDVIFHHLEHNNTNKNHIKSKMYANKHISD